MTRDEAQWWRRAAQSLSRAGLLWLALTAVALGSLISTGTGPAPSARLVTSSSIGSTGKLKGPGATVVPGELTHRVLGSDNEAKRVHAGGTPVGLLAAVLALSGPAHAHGQAVAPDLHTPAFQPSAFNARAPPARA